MSAIDEGGVWCGTCRRSALHAAEAGGCICDPPTGRPDVKQVGTAEEVSPEERYRRVGPYYVLGRIDASLARARGDGDAALAATLHLAEIAITDLIQRSDQGGPQ